jgi:PIN domain nuclease of toxin-antitoxin system
MIVIDTRTWVWWVQNDTTRLTVKYQQWLQENETNGIGVSIVSCWEVAKLVEKSRLTLPFAIAEWLEIALAYPGVRLLDLSLPIVVDSTQLTGFLDISPG